MILPSEAAFLACQDIDLIVCLIYARRLHVGRLPEQGIFVCLTSLCLASFDEDLTDDDTDFESEHELFELESPLGRQDFILKE